MAQSPFAQLRRFFSTRFSLNDNALWRLMLLLKPYRKQIVAANILLILASVCSGFGLLAFYPLLNATFEQTFETTPAAGQPPADLPTTATTNVAVAGHLTTATQTAAVQTTPALSATSLPEETSLEAPPLNAKVQQKAKMGQAIVEYADRWEWFHQTRTWLSETKTSFQQWVRQSMQRFVIVYVGFILLLYIVAGLIQFSGQFIMTRVSITVATNLMRDVYANVLRQEMTFFDQTTTGNLLNTCYREIFQMQKLIPLLTSRRVLLPVQMLIFFVLLLYINLKLSLLLIVLLPVIVVPTMIVSRRLRKSMNEEVEQETGALDVMAQGVAGIQAIKAFGAERLEVDQLARPLARHVRNSRRRRMIISIVEPMIDLLNMIVLLAIFIIAMFVFPQVFRDDKGAIIMFFFVISRFYKPMRTIMTMNVQMTRAQAVARHIFQMLDRKPAICDAPDAVPFPADWDELRFDNVDLTYVLSGKKGRNIKKREALKGVNFSVKRGEIVALVGPNGAGKSSIVKLVCRLYEPTAGAIYFGQTPLAKIRMAELRDHVCLITQHPVLFNRPVSDNIRFGLADVPQEQVEAAARAVRAHDFIMRLPQGYDTAVGETGKLLSGGERQKIVLARAFVRNPSLLIFDEPTAGLDREAVAELLDLISGMRQRGIAVIWITHEQEHLMRVDRVLELTPARNIVEIPWPPVAAQS